MRPYSPGGKRVVRSSGKESIILVGQGEKWRRRFTTALTWHARQSSGADITATFTDSLGRTVFTYTAKPTGVAGRYIAGYGGRAPKEEKFF